MNKLSIMIVGVGGQGNLLASRIIGNIGLKYSYDVKMAEVHGMAQRGGSVVTCVKLADKVHSPVIEKGEADIILALEQLEALRWLEYLKPGGKMIINEQKISPMPVLRGAANYPQNILEKIEKNYDNIITIDALQIAKECGTTKAINIVIIGVMASLLEFAKEDWIDIIKGEVPARFADINVNAFNQGYHHL